MLKYIYLIGVIVIAVLWSIFLRKLRKYTTQELENVLYIQQNTQLYLNLLTNKKLKLLYRSSSLFMFKLDAYLLLGDDSKIQEIFKLLDQSKMTKGELLEYNAKKLSYYSLKQDKDQSSNALETIDKLLKDNKKEAYIKVRDDSHFIYRIYIEHDTSLIPTLKKDINKLQGIQKGIQLFRLAKLYHYDHKDEQAKSSLQNALPLLENTNWHAIVIMAMKDIHILEYK